MGVLYERETGHKTYMNVTKADLGAGLGIGQYRVVVLIDDDETLDNFRTGVWKTGIGTESSLGESSLGAQVHFGDGFSVHFISDSGAGINATARAVRISVNEELTGNAISEVGVPNTGFRTADDQGDAAPRQWNRKLPFLAQAVIDEGYDLPLPIGIGVVYADVKQDMMLDNLKVGIQGGEIVPFEWVAFENAEAHSQSGQVKVDAWVLPFLNIFGLFGRVDGDAPMDVILDGNGMLEQMEYDCTGPLDPICLLLKDKTITLPIKAPFSGYTYGVGANLAGGWKNWFVTIPGNISVADMPKTETEGVAITLTPRAGYVFNMGRWGNLALFGGGNWLSADLDVKGYVSLEDDSGADVLRIDYEIDQVNTDAWNLVTGFNWDLNRHLSWALEYNGYIGSREAFVTSLTWRL